MTIDEKRGDEGTNAPVPFALGVVPWRQDGALRVTVVVKATFMATSPRMTPAAAPEPYRVMDVHHRNQPMARVVAASDRAPKKRAVDVTVLGHAYAAGGRPVVETKARVQLLQGSAVVLEKAVRVVGPRASRGAEAVPFVKMGLTYERAYGGLGTPGNPIGCGEEDADDDEMPNVLDPKDETKPAGFGPLSSAWPVRKKRLGGANVKEIESPFVSLPSGFDLGYFQNAPEDQQIPELSPDAVLVLEGFHPDDERIEIGLPGARAFGAVYGLDAADPDAAQPIDFRADTLHVDADARLATITFRGSVEIKDESRLDQIVVATGVGLDGRSPIIPDKRPSADRIMPASAVSPAAKDEAPVGGTLVFESTIAPPLAADVVPFAAAPPPPSLSSATLVLPLSSWGSAGPTKDLSTATMPLPFTEKPSLAGPLPPAAPLISPPALLPTVARAPSEVTPPPVPPEMLSTPEPEIPDSLKRPEELVDLERYGALAAAVDEKGAKLEAILEKEKISRDVWRKANKHWRVELDRELKAGGRALRDRYDAAYVKAWESAHPGRFEMSHYTRLLEAERGARLPQELAEQNLPTVLGMRLRRVWRNRLRERGTAEHG